MTFHPTDLCFCENFCKQIAYFVAYFKILQSRTKFMKQCQEIKQNWTGQENFEICFCIIFDH